MAKVAINNSGFKYRFLSQHFGLLLVHVKEGTEDAETAIDEIAERGKPDEKGLARLRGIVVEVAEGKKAVISALEELTNVDWTQI